MPDYPSRVFRQRQLPGTDGAESWMILHRVTEDNYTLRVTIGRQAFMQKSPRYQDIAMTKEQVLELIDELIDRIDVMSDREPPTTAR